MIETNEFIYIQRKLLKAKQIYYNKEELQFLTDYQFDMLEKQSFDIAKKLGFRADKYLGPEKNEKHHIHWMIGYNEINNYS